MFSTSVVLRSNILSNFVSLRKHDSATLCCTKIARSERCTMAPGKASSVKPLSQSTRDQWAVTSKPLSTSSAAAIIQARYRGNSTRVRSPFTALSKVRKRIYGKVNERAYYVAQDLVEWSIFRNFNFIMRKLGKRARRTIMDIDPFFFPQGKAVLGELFDEVWPEITHDLHAQYAKRFDTSLRKAKKEKLLDEADLKHWPPYPVFTDNPFRW